MTQHKPDHKQHRGKKPPIPIFVSIECSAFSGATLLAFLLNAHPQIVSIGEMDGLIPREDPDQYRCSCGQKIKVCQFWQAVGAAMAHRQFEFDTARFNTKFVFGGPLWMRRLRRGSFGNNSLDGLRDSIFQSFPSERRRVEALVHRNVAFVESVLEVTGKDIFVDTSKDFLRAKYLQSSSNLDMRAIHLVRDVRGYVASRLRRKPHLDATTVARQWVKENKRFQRQLQIFPEKKRLVIRYDDMCLHTHQTLARIFDFFGVDSTVQTTDFRAVSHHIVGNTMRLNHSSDIKFDQRWKSQLTQSQIEQVIQLAGPLSRHLGYPMSAS